MEVAAPAVCWQRFFFPKHEDNLKIYNSKTVTIWRFLFFGGLHICQFLILEKKIQSSSIYIILIIYYNLQIFYDVNVLLNRQLSMLSFVTVSLGRKILSIFRHQITLPWLKE